MSQFTMLNHLFHVPLDHVDRRFGHCRLRSCGLKRSLGQSGQYRLELTPHANEINRHHQARRQGWTSYELVVVVLLIGIASAVALPRISGSVARTRVESAAKKIQYDLELVRRTAMNKGRNISVSIDALNRTYACTEVVDGNSPSGNMLVDLATEFDPGISLLASFDATQGITFDHRGTPFVTALSGGTESTGSLRVTMAGEAMVLQFHPGVSLITLAEDNP